MKRLFVFLAIILAAAGVILAISFLAPLPIPYYQDFSVMYFTDKGLLNGIHIYDYLAQLAFIKTLTPVNFSFYPYPYPPWVAQATVYLGLLPIEVAARFWFFLNLAMIGGSAWLLTPHWKVIPRILAAFVAVMFIPAFGLLIVGQYSAPVLLGTALFIYTAKHNLPFWTAVALLLMSFKPHVGVILFLAGAGWLVFNCHCEPSRLFGRRGNLPLYGGLPRSSEDGSFAMTSYARLALWLTIIGGVILAGIGFLADPAWPLTYIQSLIRYRDLPGVQSCGLCASLSIGMAKLISGQSNTFTATWISLVLAILITFLGFWRFRPQLQKPQHLMVLAAVATLLIDPYLLNYDYVLMLIPLTWLVLQREWFFAGVLYLLPWVALLLGRSGNLILSLSALIFLIFFWKNCDRFALLI